MKGVGNALHCDLRFAFVSLSILGGHVSLLFDLLLVGVKGAGKILWRESVRFEASNGAFWFLSCQQT